MFLEKRRSSRAVCRSPDARRIGRVDFRTKRRSQHDVLVSDDVVVFPLCRKRERGKILFTDNYIFRSRFDVETDARYIAVRIAFAGLLVSGKIQKPD